MIERLTIASYALHQKCIQILVGSQRLQLLVGYSDVIGANLGASLGYPIPKDNPSLESQYDVLVERGEEVSPSPPTQTSEQ